jgi:Rrf2 family protein
VLQALVREGILKTVRGPGGGYVLAREQRRITAVDILRAAGTVNDESEKPVSGSALVDEVVDPALAKAEKAFSNTLSRITIEELTRSAALRARKGSNFG